MRRKTQRRHKASGKARIGVFLELLRPLRRTQPSGQHSARPAQLSGYRHVKLHGYLLSIALFCGTEEPTHILVMQAMLDSGTFRTDDARSEAAGALKSLTGQ